MVAPALQVQIAASISGTYGRPDAGCGPIRQDVLRSYLTSLVNGTLDGQSDFLGHVSAIADDGLTDQDRDLYVGGVTDEFAQQCSLATLTVLILSNDETTTGKDLILDIGYANPIDDFIDGPVRVKPGGIVVFIAPNAGWTLTSSKGTIRIYSPSAAYTVSYSLTVAGRRHA